MRLAIVAMVAIRMVMRSPWPRKAQIWGSRKIVHLAGSQSDGVVWQNAANGSSYAVR